MNSERSKRAEEIFKKTIGASGAERTALLSAGCGPDAELRREVEQLIESHEKTRSTHGSPAVKRPTEYADDVPTVALSSEEQEQLLRESDIGPYRIIRQLGQGGMGSVYLAERGDDQYRKQVAIKLIRQGMDSEFVLRRFRNERQILANLDHPNIAHFLDGGTTADGRPYFVMEYIEGQPIGKYCDEQTLSTVERLELFQKVCAAIHFAHQNLVIHRDIKPSNILVTDRGEPKLLDFGIAKLLNPDLTPDAVETTAAAIRLMTPEYASPEQVKGEAITTATDVYSLGVVLYELLTGHRPYQLSSHDPFEMVRVICGVEPERPSTAVSRTRTVSTAEAGRTTSITPEEVSRTREGQPDKLRRRLRGDLDNIVLMAMRKEPKRRYASVAQLSNDIQRHLERMPVIARADTFWYRSGKFVRRNKPAVAAVVLICLALAGGVVATNIQRQKAERRFNDVRQLANSFVFEFHDAIKDLPGSTPARELVVKKGLEYLDRLAAEARGDISLRRELAAAYDRVGDLQGGLYQASLGDTPGARASYEKALRIRQDLAADEPGDEEVRRGLAASYKRLGGLGWTSGDPAGAAEWYRKAAELNEQLTAANSGDQASFDLAASYIDYGYMVAASGRIEEGLDVLKKSLPIFEGLVQSNPANDMFRDNLATAYERVATVLSEGTPRTEEALVLFRQSLAIREALLKSDPINTDYRRGVAASYSNMGDAQMKLGDVAGALRSYSASLVDMRRISEEDPQNNQFRQDAAIVGANFGQALAASGDGTRALAEATTSARTLEEMLARDPTNTLLRFRVAIAHEAVGRAYVALATRSVAAAQRQNWIDARTWLGKAHVVFVELRDNGTLAGDEAARADKVAEEIAKCDAALARLKVAS